MTASEFKAEILNHYIDVEKHITIVRDPKTKDFGHGLGKWSSGNSLLHDGTFYVLLALNNIADQDDKIRFTEAVDSCWEGDKDHSVVGLLERNEGRPDKQAHDDYQGVMAASYFLNTYHAIAIAQYGENHNWSFNNVDPHSRSLVDWAKNYHGRFVADAIIPFYKMSSGQDISWFDSLQIKTAIKCGPSKDSSGAIMDWLRVQVFKKKTDKFNHLIEEWEQRAIKIYGSLGGMFAPYYGSDHPLAKLSRIDGVIS